ncbi:MAG TPA: DUF29 domain-containing protein [Beijerinckiaceae bacterium]|jgi:hypothetical protein
MPLATDATYETDFYTWAQRQGTLLRAGRFNEIDRDNIAEEIESLGRREFDKLVNAYRSIVLHMLLCDYELRYSTRSRAISIDQHRIDAAYALSDNPGLRVRQPEALERAYRTARYEAAIAVDRPVPTFSEANSYTLDDILERPFPYN